MPTTPTPLPSNPSTIDSDFARLDVKAGRQALRRRLDQGERIEVVIRGVLDTSAGSTGADDGTSREFSVEVTSAEVAASPLEAA